MKNVLTKMIYAALIASVISAIFAIPTLIVAFISGLISLVSGFSFGWIFSILLTVIFITTASILNQIYMEFQDFKIDDLDLNDEDDII
jgi:hypothetical protein